MIPVAIEEFDEICMLLRGLASSVRACLICCSVGRVGCLELGSCGSRRLCQGQTRQRGTI